MTARALGARLLAAALLTTGFTAVAAAPAQAAACERGTGVTVVVNSDVRCASAGGKARGHFTSVGHTFEDARRFPGFICRINGFPAPAQDKCINASPADAYWSLWWSDGKSGTWTYSQLGVNSLGVPTGGWVAFRWNVGGGKQQPPVRPVSAAPAPPAGGSSSGSSESSSAGKSSSRSGGGSSSSGAETPGGGADSPEAADEKDDADEKDEKDAAKDAKDDKATPTPSAAGEPSSEAVDAAPASESSDPTGSLGWVAILAIVLVLGGVGGFVAWRRRPGGTSS